MTMKEFPGMAGEIYAVRIYPVTGDVYVSGTRVGTVRSDADIAALAKEIRNRYGAYGQLEQFIDEETRSCVGRWKGD